MRLINLAIAACLLTTSPLLAACGGSGSSTNEEPAEEPIVKTDSNYIWCYENGTAALEVFGAMGAEDADIQEVLDAVLSGGINEGSVTDERVCRAALDDALAAVTP
jgi:hypothetical protein